MGDESESEKDGNESDLEDEESDPEGEESDPEDVESESRVRWAIVFPIAVVQFLTLDALPLPVFLL